MSNGRVIGLISGKGGVGKTSLSVNLSIALKQLGKDVTLVDADFGASNIGVYLGRYDHPVKIHQVLEGKTDPESAIFTHPTGIRAIVSSNEIENVEPDTVLLEDTFRAAAQNSDYVIVDCPPGLNETVKAIMAACDELIIVTMPTQTSGINAAQIIEQAKKIRKPVLGTVINKIDGDPEMELVQREVEMMTECHTMANIPYDTEMKRSLFKNQPLVIYNPLSEAALNIKEMAANLAGQPYERPKFVKLKRGLNKLNLL